MSVIQVHLYYGEHEKDPQRVLCYLYSLCFIQVFVNHNHNQREVGKGYSPEGGDQVQVQDGKKEKSSHKAGKARLRELRKMIKMEKLGVIRYLDNKREGKNEL